MKGWICLHRQLLENWVWQKPETGYAWVDLLLLANYEDVKTMYKGSVEVFKRGTVNRSISSLAERWGWSRDKTRSFLKALESDGMISIKTTTHQTTITIEKYSDFQDSPTTNQSTNRQQTVNKPTQITINKQLINNNKRAKGNRFLDFFQRSDDLNSLITEEAREKTYPTRSP